MAGPGDPSRGASPRLLRLLALFQRAQSWPAEELARELEVDPRTVRRDVARLRHLGYPVETTLGPGGGYHLPRGVALPPMTLETDEAVAILLALQQATVSSVDGSAAATALAKLRAVMPARLRTDTEALAAHTTDLRVGEVVGERPPAVAVDHLVTLARACRHRRRVDAVVDDGPVRGSRTLEPHRLVRALARWYVVAHLGAVDGWAALRVDRLGDVVLADGPSTHHLDRADAEALVRTRVVADVRRVTGVVRVHAPLARVARWVEPAWGDLEADGDATVVHCGAGSYEAMASWLLLLGAEVTVVGPTALREAFAAVAERAARAGRPAG